MTPEQQGELALGAALVMFAVAALSFHWAVSAAILGVGLWAFGAHKMGL